jgi:ubiquinol-cytochrome c reductase iron-sulfur subunit
VAGEVVDHIEEPPPSAAAERLAAGAFVVSMLAALGLAATYLAGGQPQVEGALLALALGGIGVGLVAWAKRFLPGEEVAEERAPLASSAEELRAFTGDFERGGQAVGRRRLLVRLLGGSLAALGVAALFPVRSLGPRPGRGLFTTAYRPGARLVDADGRLLRPADVPAHSVVTVWPEGDAGAGDSPTLLLNVGDRVLAPPPGREGWTVDGIVAYSKLCTHTGCPVGLYQSELNLLLCPCHQSTFDVLRGAEPIFGPAARPLPQLPLAVDDAGYLVATGDFSAPVGPGFWNRDRT